MPAMSAKEQILERFDSLSPTLQRAARFVVDNPNEVVIGSMRRNTVASYFNEAFRASRKIPIN